MAQGISRRDALKLGAAAAGFGVLRMTSVAQARQNSDTLLKAGIVTDMHHTTRTDSETRKYSAAMKKMQVFTESMSAVKPAFVVELGDFVDTLSMETEPLKNLAQIETRFACFPVRIIMCWATMISTTSGGMSFWAISPIPALSRGRRGIHGMRTAFISSCWMPIIPPGIIGPMT